MDRTKLRAAIGEIAGANPAVKLAYLHGSYAGFKPTPLSDVDIAILLDLKLHAGSRWDLEADVEESLERPFPGLDFDVRIMNGAPLSFQGKVITYGENLYAAGAILRADYEERVRKLYFDFRPFAQSYCLERLRTIREEGLAHG